MVPDTFHASSTSFISLAHISCHHLVWRPLFSRTAGSGSCFLRWSLACMPVCRRAIVDASAFTSGRMGPALGSVPAPPMTFVWRAIVLSHFAFSFCTPKAPCVDHYLTPLPSISGHHTLSTRVFLIRRHTQTFAIANLRLRMGRCKHYTLALGLRLLPCSPAVCPFAPAWARSPLPLFFSLFCWVGSFCWSYVHHGRRFFLCCFLASLARPRLPPGFPVTPAVGAPYRRPLLDVGGCPSPRLFRAFTRPSSPLLLLRPRPAMLISLILSPHCFLLLSFRFLPVLHSAGVNTVP